MSSPIRSLVALEQLMPLYEYGCPACGARVEILRLIAERHNPVECGCRALMTLRLSLPAQVAPDIAPYYDLGLDARIESRRHRRQVMREIGAEEKGTSRLHGAKGTGFSFPGKPMQAAKPSGGYAKPE